MRRKKPEEVAIMNINDIEEVNIDYNEEPLTAIFKKQEALEEKYKPLEEKQGVGYGLLQGRPFDINHICSQELLKNLTWRIVEELTEATTAHSREHFEEEMVDALHFLVALAINVNISPEDIVPNKEGNKFDHLFKNNRAISNPYWIIQKLGLAMNCLKQKPWKQTHILTDEQKLKEYIIEAFYEFGSFCRSSRLSSYKVYFIYFKKHTVNTFRINSGY